MRGEDSMLLLAGAAAVAAYLYSQSSAAAASTPTPYSIYPEYAYTAQTSMAATPAQQASTKAVVLPTPAFTAVQGQEQAALLTQCAGSYPGCTVIMADTQLGF